MNGDIDDLLVQDARLWQGGVAASTAADGLPSVALRPPAAPHSAFRRRQLPVILLAAALTAVAVAIFIDSGLHTTSGHGRVDSAGGIDISSPVQPSIRCSSAAIGSAGRWSLPSWCRRPPPPDTSRCRGDYPH